jgi:molybdenum-dependent DNA-binding transcriptional regulator ModE
MYKKIKKILEKVYCDGQVSGAGSTALTNYKDIFQALKEIKQIIKKEK